MYYEARGTGPAVVLVHGGLVDSRLWDDQMEPLAQRFRVVRYDLRGYGALGGAGRVLLAPRRPARLLDLLKLEKATLVGLSLGGIIAADFALEHPERVERLVLVGPGLRGDKQPPPKDAAAAVERHATGGRSLRRSHYEDGPATPPSGRARARTRGCG